MELGRLLVLLGLHAAYAHALRGHDVQAKTGLTHHAAQHAPAARHGIRAQGREMGPSLL